MTEMMNYKDFKSYYEYDKYVVCIQELEKNIKMIGEK